MAETRSIISWEFVGRLKGNGTSDLEYSIQSDQKDLTKLIETRRAMGDKFVLVRGNNEVVVPVYMTTIS